MAQRSITSFFKSPTQQTRTASSVSDGDKKKKKVLISPENVKSKKLCNVIEKAAVDTSPMKTVEAVLSPKCSDDKKSFKAENVSSEAENSPISAVSEDSNSNILEGKGNRKRRRISSSSSSGSNSESPPEVLELSNGSLSTDYNDLDSSQNKSAKKQTPKAYEKPKETKSKPAVKSKGTKKTKSPAVRGKKKKTPAKTAKLEPPSVKTENPKEEATKEHKTNKLPQLEIKPEEKPSTKVEPISKSSATKTGDYDPSKEKYDPDSDATWKSGEKTPFLCLARTLDYAEKTSSRNRTMETVANFFSSVIRLSPNDLSATVFMCLGVVAPAHTGIETSIGEGALQKALSKATGRTIPKIKEDLQKIGDIGEVAEMSRQVQPKLGFTLAKPQSLTIPGVFSKLREIAAMSGTNSQNQRIDNIVKMLTLCQGVEAKFLVRLLTGKLRVGLAEQSVLIALAHSAVFAKCKTAKEKSKYAEDKEALAAVAKALRLAFANCPDVERVTKAMAEVITIEKGSLIEPLLELPSRCPIEPGLPVKPMLAQPSKSLHEIVEKLGIQAKDELAGLPGKDSEKPGRILACEYKYDGERAEIHVFFPNGSEKDPVVKIYSRNQEDHTVRFSEVANRISAEAVLPEAKGKTLIIDSEIVAVDSNGRHLPFQMLAARKRKETTAEEEAEKTKSGKEASVPAYQAIAFVFDCFFIDGQSLVGDTLLERRRKVRECIKPIPGLLEWAVSYEIDIDEQEHEVEEKVGQWLEESVRDGCEGLIVKTATSKYMVARRAPCWLKLKKDYIDTDASSSNAGMGGDSVDLVVVAGYWGAGKRTGRLGAFLLASYDSLDDQYETVCKLGTGLSDELLEQLTEQLMPIAKPQGAPAPSYVKHSPGLPEPNVWLEPSVVWEIRAADLSLSNVHTAGLGSIPGAPDRGVSLRFPRYIRARPDKKPEDATTSDSMCRRYANQQQVQFAAEGKGKAAVDDDFY